MTRRHNSRRLRDTLPLRRAVSVNLPIPPLPRRVQRFPVRVLIIAFVILTVGSALVAISLVLGKLLALMRIRLPVALRTRVL